MTHPTLGLSSGAAVRIDLERLLETRARQRRWVAENREHVRDYHRAYRAAHPELKEAKRAHYIANRAKRLAEQKRRIAAGEGREQRAAYQRAYRAANGHELNEKARQRRLANHAAHLARERAWRLRHREKKLARDAEYRRRNLAGWKASIERSKAKKPALYREHAKASNMRRRARFASIPIERGVMPSRVFARDANRCHLCGDPVAAGNGRSLDHLIPVVRGGAHAEWNLATAHTRCNQRRGTRALFVPETRENSEAYIGALRRAT